MVLICTLRSPRLSTIHDSGSNSRQYAGQQTKSRYQLAQFALKFAPQQPSTTAIIARSTSHPQLYVPLELNLKSLRAQFVLTTCELRYTNPNAEKSSTHYTQFSNSKPSTRSNSLILFDTSVWPRDLAWAAIQRSLFPMGVPFSSSARRIPA